MADIAEQGLPDEASPTQVEQFEQDLRDARVDVIVLPDARPEAPALLTSLTSAFGAPVHTGGVYAWDVREVTDGAR
jgi:hypothetical protein